MKSSNNREKVILVADDDPGILEVIGIILSDKGYKIAAVDNPVLITKTIKETHPRLILIDLWMSGMDGHEAIQIIKRDPAFKHLPIVVISALTDGEKIAAAAGADDFLAKPFDLEDLLAIVKKYSS